MTAIYNTKHANTGYEMLPFGGKKMIFLADPAQLCPIGGAAIYDNGIWERSTKSPQRQIQKWSVLVQEVFGTKLHHVGARTTEL